MRTADMPMNTAMSTDATGSRMRHLSPRKYAADTPMRVAMDEMASLRWCHALAMSAGEPVWRAADIV